MGLWQRVGQNVVSSTLWFREVGDAYTSNTPTTTDVRGNRKRLRACGVFINRSTIETVRVRKSPL
jgi:cation transport regulator ChaC